MLLEVPRLQIEQGLLAGREEARGARADHHAQRDERTAHHQSGEQPTVHHELDAQPGAHEPGKGNPGHGAACSPINGMSKSSVTTCPGPTRTRRATGLIRSCHATTRYSPGGR